MRMTWGLYELQSERRKEGYIREYKRDYYIGAVKGDTGSLDYGSYVWYIQGYKSQRVHIYNH